VELGVEPGAEPDTIRRAYLRKVKVHKPEVDPDGFKRVREAFEVLGRWAAFQAHLRRQQTESAPEPGAAPPAPAPEPPPSSEASPAPLPAAAAISTAPSSASKWAEVAELLTAKRHDEARALMVRLFSGEEALGPAPHPEQLLFVLLELQAASPGEAGREALKAYAAWLDRTQQELALSQQGPRWLFTRELMRLPNTFPPELEALIAVGVLSGDFDKLFERLRAYTRESPARADGAIMSLADRAPTLHQIISPWLNPDLVKRWDANGGKGPLIEPAREAAAPRSSSSPSARWLFLIPALIGLTQVFNSHPTSYRSSTGNYLYPPLPRASGPSSPTADDESPSPADRSVLNDIAGEVCKKAPEACKHARQLERAQAQRDCFGAKQAMLNLEFDESSAKLRQDKWGAQAIGNVRAFYRYFTDTCQ
jgi:hypothetical protein